MTAVWDFYWPAIMAAVVIGLFSGIVGFRLRGPAKKRSREASRKRTLTLVAGGALALALTALWHDPLGAAERFASSVEARANKLLVDFEMPAVRAHLERNRLRRTLVLSGPADDFQRGELVRIMNEQPGVANVRWMDSRAPFTLPLFAEAELAALAGFGIGLMLSYLLELRRRSRAEWRW